MSPVLIAAVLVTIAAATGFVIGRRTGTRPAAGSDAPSPDDFVASINDFGRDVIPVWSAQVESSRRQMEDAVGALISRFAGIVTLLESALGGMRTTRESAPHHLFATSENRLGEIVASLEDALDRKNRTVAQLRDLLGLNQELKDMISEVRKLATQTHLLALNASIEAARVGDAGRAFTVIAAEVGQLAEMSGKTSERIALKADEVSGAIDGVCVSAEDEAEHEGTTVTEAGGKVDEVLGELRQMVENISDSSHQLGTAAEDIQRQIEQSLVQFQFQDRLAQTLEHLRDSVDDFRAQLQAAQPGPGQIRPLDTAHLLAALSASYTMAEEVHTHRSGVPAPVADSDITFF